MRLVGRGDGAIRATHAKTLEFTADPHITERATCIVAVGSALEDAGRPAGPVLLTVRAGDESFAFEALGNPGWTPGGTAVVRRSGRRRPGTLATEATAGAADLPRPLVEVMRDPAAVVELTVDPIHGRPAIVLVALDPYGPPDPRLAAELAAADLVLAEDEGAAALLGERVAHGRVRVDGRVLVAATRELPGSTVAGQLATVPVDVLGLSPALAAAAASPSRAPFTVDETGDASALLRKTPAAHRLVVRAPSDDVPALLELAVAVRGSGAAVLVAPESRPQRISTETFQSPGGRETVHLCFDAISESIALDPSVVAAVRGLLADGVPTKTAANALAALTGWERRRAYDTVLGWRAT